MAEERKETIPEAPGMLDIVRAQGQAQPLLGEIRQVDRQMAPEGAVVVPDMMVLVAGVAADRQFRLFVHGCVLSFGGARTRRI